MTKTPQAPINSPFNMKATSEQIMKGIDLTGKSIIVTGGYSGIGLKITESLVKAGANVTVPARTLDKAKNAVGHLKNVEIGTLDLMDNDSIDAFAEDWLSKHDHLDILVECAGIMFAPLRRDKNGNESHLSTNYLGHFRLTSRLYPALQAAGNARVVIATSRAQSWNGVDFEDPNFEHREYDPRVAYAQSKAADILFAVGLDRRSKSDGIRAFAVHPGLVPGTGLGRFVNSNKGLQTTMGFVMNQMQFTRAISTWNSVNARLHGEHEYDYFKTVSQGAADLLWAATSPLLTDKGGVFIEDSNIGVGVPADSESKFGARPWSIDPALAEQLWTLGEKLSHTEFDLD